MKHTSWLRRTELCYARSAIAAGLTMAAALCVSAQSTTGQDEEEQSTLKLDKFVVTGSLIPIAADTPAIPITVMTAVDIEKFGENRDLGDVLRKANPFFFGRANLGAENANTRANGTNGASTISLRNRSTLVLINGRRAAISPVAATGGGAFVDVSLIPVGAVERIEVLTDGASATYGTDAVSGVVNIILKSNYNGAEIGGSYGWAPDAGNYSTRRVNFSIGASNEKTSVLVSGEWRKSDPLWQYERPWSLRQFRTPSFAGVITPDLVNFYYLNPSLNAPPQNVDMTLADLIAAGVYSGPFTQDQVAQFFDLSERANLFMSSQRRSMAIAAQHKLTDDITAFADILITNSLTENTLNAQPVSGNVAASHANNPFNVTVQARNRFRAFPRIRRGDTLGGRAVFGLRGRMGDTWTWEVGTSLNRSTQALRQINLIDSVAYNAAVADGTYNPFARVQVPGVIERIVGTGYQDYVSRLIGFDARFSGDIFDLPAGPVQLGIGLETRSERVSMTNDRNDQRALWLGGTPTLPFAAKQTVDGASLELRIPVFSPQQSMPFFNTLELGVAARKEIYSTTTDPLVPKVSLRWLPFNDEFAVRATYGESFSAPTIFALYGPGNAGFTTSINLNRYNSDGTQMLNANGTPVTTGNRQYNSRGSNNPNLIPSESRNWSAGFVWSPRAVKGFNLTADWFNIDERALVGRLGAGTILGSIEQFGAASPYASWVRLGGATGGELLFDSGSPITQPGQITSGASTTVWLSSPFLNIAGTWQSGADVRLEYTYNTQRLGKFVASTVGTYIHDYWIQNLPTTAPINATDMFTGTSTLPRFRTFSTLDWSWKQITAGVSHSYIPDVDDLGAPTNAAGDAPVVDSWQTFDVRASYSFSGADNRWLNRLKLSAGINNVFSEDPPFSAGETDQNRDINTYDALGRYFWVSATYKF